MFQLNFKKIIYNLDAYEASQKIEPLDHKMLSNVLLD